MKEKFKSLLSNYKTMVVLYLVFAIAASVLSLNVGSKFTSDDGKEYKRYNNYVIFQTSFDHLIDSKDLYIHHPEDHYDLYKYSPTFSVFFGVFHYMPDWLGLNLWNILNALIF